MTDTPINVNQNSEIDAQTTPEIPDILPVLPLINTVIVPMAVAPIVVGQERSVKLVDEVMRTNRLVALVAQRHPEARPAGPDDIYRVGTAAIIHRLLRLPDGTLQLVVQGLKRIRILDFLQTEPFLVARIETSPEQVISGVTELEALRRTLGELFSKLVPLTEDIPNELAAAGENISDPRLFAYLVAAMTPMETPLRQEILELDAVENKLQRLIEIVQQELAVRELQQQIASDAQEKISKSQREYILREQLKSIQRELGEENAEQAEIQELRNQLEAAQLPEEARKEAFRELSRLERLPAISPEYGMIRTYLDWMVSLPWNTTTGEAIDLGYAHQVLDEDHYDLEKIKDRILEYLAVKKLKSERAAVLEEQSSVQEKAPEEAPASQKPPETVLEEIRREPILCFVGPPGVGKTSLGQSIARAMGRKFVRISLGGVSDEAEIRGHRRTYIGALPGRLIQALRRAETADPVFMLDEVDKLGRSFQGDPAAALLEVLDPAQNHTFVDTYLGVPFDLSRVLFICTANTVETIPSPLLDRMEILSLSGYTELEKLHIARRYLLPKQLRANGLKPEELAITDAALQRIIREYTREAGVRSLEREIGAVVRKVARQIAEGKVTATTVEAEQLPDYLRRPRFLDEVVERIDRPGIATGLAWTPAGGDVLFVEATMMPGRAEQLVLTGMLGDVMRESAQAALSYVRSNGEKLGIDPKVFMGKVVHVHVPAGATPKDGPSAGVTMVTAIASVASGRLVRNDVAMTGEITLRGKVLPVGGIREKVLAAYRAGIKTVILPQRNEPDLEDVPEEVRHQLQFVPVSAAEEVLATALTAANLDAS
ncbi:endopeptidase La [Fischerella sp. NIES-3754]|uniref:endopeptidase La n=1 Tax=Fischerella sp. NIES-3754 TaxID=1752063 RepID=UPI000722F360|nr:endopeptidase La [Fischerella sp. NIES-3754]BAU05738.1 ATP-dependent protease Lon [Fischerella sp. NIES-3754]BCX08010.1 MAG: Lon protease [Fischerella sp.]